MIAALLLLATSQGALVEGNPNSSVRVVIYEDLQCPDCADFRRMLDEKLLPKYGGKVAFEHRDFPLPKHKWAKPASVASRWFQEQKQGLAIEWRRVTMAERKTITPENLSERVRAFAKKNGLDPDQAVKALTEEHFVKLVEKDYEEGVARGIARTPTALVNGEPFIETFTFEEISAGIERELKNP